MVALRSPLGEVGLFSFGIYRQIAQMFYVCRLRSKDCPTFSYTGYTTDLKRRLAEHDRGQVAFTAEYATYELIFYAAFDSVRAARNFEDYLKTGSGKAFAKKRLWPE